MSETTQNYASHTRWHPPFHFILSPIILINLIWSVVRLYLTPSFESGWLLVMAIALVILTLLVRTNPLRVQDRLIRLEEQLRYQRLLAPELAARASALPVRNIVALRFASDAELAELVQQILEGKLTTAKEIKQAIRNWRADTLRV